MKDLLSKQHYCYKTHTSLMKTSAYLLFYRQLNPPPSCTPPLYGYMGYPLSTPLFLQKNLDPPLKFFYKNPNCHISKGGGGGVTLWILHMISWNRPTPCQFSKWNCQVFVIIKKCKKVLKIRKISFKNSHLSIAI